MKNILFHLEKPSTLPVGVVFDVIKNIEQYDNGSIDHILLQDLLDYYETSQVEIILQEIVKKIKPGGIITIQSIDIKHLAISIVFEEIDIDTVKNILYPNKKTIHTLYDIEKILNHLGYTTINKKYINLFEYYITAKNK